MLTFPSSEVDSQVTQHSPTTVNTTVLFPGTILEGGSMRTADYGVVPLMGSDVDKPVKFVVTNAYVVRKKLQLH